MRFDKFLNSQLLTLKNFCFFQFQIINNKRIMSFQEHFNITNIYKNNFNSKKQVYKYFHTQDDEYSYSEVYDYFKQYIKNLKITNSFTTICLYTIQNNIKHHIFSKIIYGNKIIKDKFTEDKTLQPPFEVFISIETFDIPVFHFQNTIKKQLRPTFKFSHQYIPTTSFDGTLKKKLYFYSRTIQNGTPEEIFNHCLPHVLDFQCKYKKDRIDNFQITKSIYEVIITNGNYSDKCLYYIEIDTEGDTLEESTYNISLPPTYKILIKITLVYDPQFIQQIEEDRQTEIEELEFRIQQLNNELETLKTNIKNNKKCKKEEICCICLSSPSNILFTNCGHLCICENCDNKLSEAKCPLCRTKVTQQKIII